MFKGDSFHSLSYEQQAKFIQDRITSVEKNFGELCFAFGNYARKTARLRDKGDELAKTFKIYSSNELVNKSLSTGLDNLSTTLSAVEEYRNCEIQRIEAKVIGELSQYENICKHAREEVKHTISVREKEMTRKKILDKARERQPFNRQQVTYAESELLKASAEMSRTAKGLSEQTEFFEKRKLQQLKSLLSDFIMTEMTFHAKAVELFTVAFHQVNDINEASDLENFKRKLMSPERQTSSGLYARSTSLGSLLMNQSTVPEDSTISKDPKSPERILSAGIARSSSLGTLLNQSPKRGQDDTSESEDSEESDSEETETD